MPPGARTSTPRTNSARSLLARDGPRCARTVPSQVRAQAQADVDQLGRLRQEGAAAQGQGPAREEAPAEFQARVHGMGDLAGVAAADDGPAEVGLQRYPHRAEGVD